MWTCSKCSRTFRSKSQPHSCSSIPIEEHFQNKAKAKEIFEYLLSQINRQIGQSRIISLPCCIHLFGTHDYLAALPKKDKLEIRFTLNRKIDSPKLIQCVPISADKFKNCLDLTSLADVNIELLTLINESYQNN